MDINLLVKLTSKAWSLDILALLHAGTPGRQAALLSASLAGRTAFVQSLRHLIEIRLLERNPGHGHPLRPEYRLTPQGVEMAAIADRIKKVVPQHSEHGLLRRAWSLPVLIVSHKPRFFTEIKSNLLPITDRALAQTLRQLQLQHWLHRKVNVTLRPARPLYHATGVGSRIAKAAMGSSVSGSSLPFNTIRAP